MNGLIGAVGLLLVVVQYGSFNPDPLNDLTINFNIKDSTRAFADMEFEADNEEPHPVIIGGITSNKEPLQDLEIFDGSWKPFPPGVDHIIYETAAATYQNKLYLVGGLYKGKEMHDVPLKKFPLLIERQENGEWDMVNDLNYKRKLHTATVVYTVNEGSQLFVTGGEGDDTEVSRYTEVYKLGPLEPGEKREWMTESNMKFQRIEHAAVVYKGELYVIGGRPVRGPGVYGMRNMEIFRKGKWILLDRNPKIMKQKRMGHGAEVTSEVLKEEVIVVCGGKSRESVDTDLLYLRKCETFNGVKWDDDNIGDMEHKRSNFGLMSYGGKLWAFGGFNEDGALSSVEFCVKNAQSPNDIPTWKLEDPKNFLKKPRAYFGVTKYSIPTQPKPSKKRLLEQANIINSTFV